MWVEEMRIAGAINSCLPVLSKSIILSGYWNIIVYGRKHSYRVYTKMLNEAMRWTAAIQGVIDSKTPIETPTLQLIRDIKVKLAVHLVMTLRPLVPPLCSHRSVLPCRRTA